ncbi:MAG: hypothetical protein OYK82_03480 [Gammaproteobacteria bacterium]|nr:hypothetical protein [Gammaproteobacteria bacterium]
MSEISLARIARALDAMLDDQMTAQARIAAHLVAVAEAAGHDAARVIETLDGVVAATVLDEIWITDEKGFAYLTTVRDEAGVRVPFRFSPDPAVQPQASTFYSLLASPVGGDDAVTQPAQVREIDHEIFKYVGVGGIDRHRIVQVGNAPAFDEQDVVSNAYTSPVMTAVMAAFGEPELLSAAYTSRLDEIRTVLDGILGHQMIVQARLAECLVTAVEEAESSRTEIEGRLRRIVGSTSLGEIHVATLSGEMIYTSLPHSSARDRLPDGVLDPGDVGRFREGTPEIVHETAPRAFDGAVYKYVSVTGAGSPRLVHVGQPIGPDSPVSLHFPSSGGVGA